MGRTRTVEAVRARQTLGQLMDEAFYRGEQFVIERAGRPMVAVVPIEQFVQWQKRRGEFFAVIDGIRERTKNVPSKVLEADIREAVRAVRRQESGEGRTSKAQTS